MAKYILADKSMVESFLASRFDLLVRINIYPYNNYLNANELLHMIYERIWNFNSVLVLTYV
jgi:hypothetical protein